VLTKQISGIRDSAADLLSLVHREDTSPGKTPATTTATPATRGGRGPVDAPGKRHRKPGPQERIDTRMGETRGKKMGQKSFKIGRRSGRG
jgi:hypothetical protein